MIKTKHTELLRAWESLCVQQAGKVRWQAQAQAPDTWDKVQASFAGDGIIRVWNGGSEQTIFSTPMANFAFRAWHDGVHLAHGLDFTLAGEERVCERQCAQVYAIAPRGLRKQFARILEVEIVEQASAYVSSGMFVANQREFMEARL